MFKIHSCAKFIAVLTEQLPLLAGTQVLGALPWSAVLNPPVHCWLGNKGWWESAGAPHPHFLLPCSLSWCLTPFQAGKWGWSSNERWRQYFSVGTLWCGMFSWPEVFVGLKGLDSSQLLWNGMIWMQMLSAEVFELRVARRQEDNKAGGMAC